jgi:hypothetical protein
MKIPISWGATITVTMISLAIWVFFDAMGMRLDPPATAVVVLVVAAVVMLARWVWLRTRAKGEAK